jgi:uncharacterized protein (DUF983 family)
MKSTEIKVIKIAIRIQCECPHCNQTIGVLYDEFINIVGQPCDWKYSKFHCTKCGNEIEIDSVDWD